MERKKRAAFSLTEKKGAVAFARGLVDLGWEIISTGGTADALIAGGVPCVTVESVTGFPEMLDGRVKTLHPAIHGGILANRSLPEHMTTIAKHGILPIDLVAVNLYAFQANPGIEQIDVGGPALLRSAAKNCDSVIVVVDPDDYVPVLAQLTDRGSVYQASRLELARKVFKYTSDYDASISAWIEGKIESGENIFENAVSTH